MIAACPKCNARYRVDPERVGPQGAKLKCAKCESVFRVKPPESGEESQAPAAPAVQPQAAPSAPARTRQPAPPAPSGSDELDRTRLVLIADPDPEAGKRSIAALQSWGLQGALVHDGVEAMLTIQRTLPRVVVLDAALPKMYGFQVCEIVKRNESLRDTKVILVGAIHHQDRYRRQPADLYGADVYLEQPDLPDGLGPLLRDFGLPLSGGGAPTPSRKPAAEPAAPTPDPAPVATPRAPEPAPAPVAAAPPPEPAPVGDGQDDERSKAQRLARIAVSEMVLYQPERFEEALRAGNLVEAFHAEITEGRALLRQRVSEAVREERDYLVDELNRVARERGGA